MVRLCGDADVAQGVPFWIAIPSEAAAGQAHGLSRDEAALRLRRDGPNVIGAPRRQKIWRKLRQRLTEPLVAILLLAGLVSGLTGEISSAIIIAVIVAISVTLDIAQEHRAETAAEALKRSVAVHCDVWRDGRLIAVPVSEIVVGDVVHLSAGDLVPADGIVIDSSSARVNEAMLTGEPYAVEKQAGHAPGAALAQAGNAVFGGTALVSGSLRFVVVATGRRSQFGGIAAALASEEPPTAFQRGVHGLGVLILRLTGFLVLFVLLAHLSLHRPVLESFLFAIALAVGLTPELLPMIMTVTLARGALRMAARQVVVKRLTAIHDLGGMDVLCTDKTGTLTEARIELLRCPDIAGTDSARVLNLAAIDCHFAGDERSPLDEAILARAGVVDWSGHELVTRLPFDFERRRASALVRSGDGLELVTKGAPEDLLARCVAVEDGAGQTRPLTSLDRDRIAVQMRSAAGEGLRSLAVAWRRMDRDADVTPEDERDLVFAGLCLFIDPPKQTATGAIARLRALGVKVKIISGDAPEVVSHLVTTLGLDCHGLLSGPEIDDLNAQALALRCESVDLYVRVTPAQKMRVIRALQARGHTVGFLGDGINDAPAIKAADAGISVEGATEVARDAADMILLTSDLNVLADGVEEGRRTYANITKYVRMGTSSNFGNMVSMAIASLAVPFLPLTPVQVLLNNLLYDFSEIGIPFDRVDRSDLATPHAWDMRAVLRFTMIMGPLSSLFDLATFALLLLVFHAGPETFRTAWFIESMATQILVIFMIRTSGVPWSTPAHPVLVATSLGALALAIGLPLSPLAPLLGFGPLPPALYLTIFLIVLLYLLCALLVKPLAAQPGKPRSVGKAP
jgi:Mg2+-importing ATPase